MDCCSWRFEREPGRAEGAEDAAGDAVEEHVAGAVAVVGAAAAAGDERHGGPGAEPCGSEA